MDILTQTFLIFEAVVVNLIICTGLGAAILKGYKDIDSRVINTNDILTKRIEMLTKKIVDMEKNHDRL
jgi:hypothetical protein